MAIHLKKSLDLIFSSIFGQRPFIELELLNIELELLNFN